MKCNNKKNLLLVILIDVSIIALVIFMLKAKTSQLTLLAALGIIILCKLAVKPHVQIIKFKKGNNLESNVENNPQSDGHKN